MVIDFNSPITALPFWRGPTKREQKAGNRSFRHVNVPVAQALDTDGTVKKSIKWKDGYEYFYKGG